MKLFFGWDNFKKLFIEWLMTFSNKDSKFSSKRITQFCFGFVGVGLTITVSLYNIDKFTAMEQVAVISPLFLYGGYTLNQTQKEKKDEKTTDNTPASGTV